MRTVSFIGWTLAASAGLGGKAPPEVGVISGINFYRALKLKLPRARVKPNCIFCLKFGNSMTNRILRPASAEWQMFKMRVLNHDPPALCAFFETNPDILRHFRMREAPELPFQSPEGGRRKLLERNMDDARSFGLRQAF